MIQKNIPLRAHHGLCLAFFEGKGYDDVFALHMGEILRQMQTNPHLQILAEKDVICEECPNLEKEGCNTFHQVKEYDKKVLSYCGLQENTLTDWNTFSALISEKILKQGKRSLICGDCEWNDICSAKEEKRGWNI